MHISPKMLSVSFLCLAMLAGKNAWAATPQEILNNDLSSFNMHDGYSLNGQFTVNVDETLLKSAPASYRQGPQDSSAVFEFQARALPKQEGLQDSEGRFVLTKASMQAGDQKYDLTDPVKLQWAKVDPDVYWRIEQVPSAITDFLKGFVDITPYIGQWIKIPGSDASSSLALLPQIGQSEGLKTQAEDWAAKKYLQVIRTEKRFKNAQGEDMARVRVTINRSALYKDYLANLRAAYAIKDKTERNNRIKALRTAYNDTLKEINKLTMAANINLARQRLDRLEFAVNQKTPKQDCSLNEKTFKSVCRTIGSTTIQVIGGINFLPIDLSPIVAPENALDWSALQNTLASSTQAIP